MGVMRFLVPERERLPPNAVERAYFSGMEDIPWQGETAWTNDGFVLRRAISDSGNLHFPWPVAGHGELMLSTGSLMEREDPYHLSVELARGTVNRIRNQLAVWEPAGLVVPAEVAATLAAANAHLSRAVTHRSAPATASEHAQQAIVAASIAITQLGASYAEQVMATHRRDGVKSTTLLAVNLGSSLLKENVQRAILGTFNTAAVPLTWRAVEAREGKHDWRLSDRQIEWSRARGLKICGGPLIQLDKRSLPDWLYLWEDDEENLASFVAGQIRAVVDRYRGKVHLWQCAARINAAGALALSEEQRLRLAALAIETTRAADARTPIVLTIDQPWAEYMAHEDCEFSPLHFADALVRADLGLAGIGLEINLGYWPGGTQPRDLLDFNRQIDRWSALGLPLLVVLTVPSGMEKDVRSHVDAQTLPFGPAGGPTDGSQRAWVEEFLPLLMAKQPVQGVIWNQLLDSQPHDYLHGGLFDAHDEAKTALAAIQATREQCIS